MQFFQPLFLLLRRKNPYSLGHVIPYHMTINLVIKNLIISYQICLMTRPMHVHLDKDKKARHGAIDHPQIVKQMVNPSLISTSIFKVIPMCIDGVTPEVFRYSLCSHLLIQERDSAVNVIRNFFNVIRVMPSFLHTQRPLNLFHVIV